MNTTLQTITSPHTGSSKITPPTTSSWRGLYKRVVILLLAFAWGTDTWALDGIPGSGTEGDPYVISGTNVNKNWTNLKTAMAEGGYIRLNANCTDGTNSSDSYLEVPEDKAVTLNLNGKTINRGLTSAIENGFVIRNLGNLTINDSGSGIITGGYNSGEGGGIYNKHIRFSSSGLVIKNCGFLTINGGKIRGNRASKGAGIYNTYQGSAGNDPTLTINGGKIESNTAEGDIASNTGNGGGIWNQANLAINGGSIDSNTANGNGGGIWSTGTLTINNCNITGNSATNGGGIYYQYVYFYMYGGTITGNSVSSGNKGGGILIIKPDNIGNHDVFYIHGNITVQNNTSGTVSNNVHLTSTTISTVTFNRHFNIDGSLNSSTRIGVTVEGAPRDFTAGLSGNGNASNFPSDDASYVTRLNGDNEAILKKIISSAAVTVTAPKAATAFNSTATCSTAGVASASLVWKRGSTDVTSGTATAGNQYTAQVTITPSDNYEFASSTSVTINNNTATVTTSGNNRKASYTFPATEKRNTTPWLSYPNASSIIYGQSLSNSTLSGGRVIQDIPGTFTWTDPSIKPNAGTRSYSVTFTPNDQTNFNTSTNNINLTTSKATPSVEGTAIATAIYGTQVKNIPISGLTATFNSETVAGSCSFQTISANNARPSVGNTTAYAARFNPASSNYNSVDLNLVPAITPKDLTVTANNHSITYGDEPANNGVGYSGFVNNETAAVLGGELAYAYNYAQYGDVGSYTITPSGLTSSNYEITFTAGTLTVEQKEVGLTWSTPTTFEYDGEVHGLTATATGLVNGDEIGVTVTGEQTNAGNHTATASALTGTKAGNYKLPDANTQGFTINRRDVTVTPNDGQSKTYGDSDPTITYNVDGLLGLVPGESLSGTLERAAGEDVNTYAITQGTVTNENNGNYNITFTTGKTFTITPKTIGISWGPTILTYNSSAQAPTATATGLVGSDVCNLSVTGQQTAVGVYTITDAPATVTALDNTNYQLPTTGLTTGFEIVNPLSISFAANQKWATWYGGYNFEVPTGMTAYKVSSVSGSTVTVDAITYVPANTGVLIKRTATEAAVANSNVYNGETSVITSLLRNGSPTPYIDYILYNDGFVLSSVSTLGDHRCYLPASGAAATRGLTIEIGDGTTDIAPKVVEEIDTGEWYDLQGRRIEKPQKKGLYIRDGKKIVVK